MKARTITPDWIGSVTGRRSKPEQAVLGSLFFAGSVVGLGMKVKAYLHPGIFPQGPLWNEVWIDILRRMLQAVHRDAGGECISGPRFVHRAQRAKGGLFDGIRVAEIARDRPACHRTPIAAFVPIADMDRLRRAWINEAPEPMAGTLSSPLDEIAELAESRRLIAAIHGSTSWQITAPMRALASAYRAALGKARWVCRQGAATSDRASKPSFGKVTAYGKTRR